MEKEIKNLLIMTALAFVLLSSAYFPLRYGDFNFIGRATSISFSAIVNNKPVFNSTVEDMIFNKGDGFSYIFYCTDADGHTITYLDDTALFDIDPISGAVEKTFKNADVGTWDITVSCYDGIEYDEQSFRFVVNVKNGNNEGGGSSGSDDDVNETEEIEVVAEETENLSTITGAHSSNLKDLKKEIPIEIIQLIHDFSSRADQATKEKLVKINNDVFIEKLGNKAEIFFGLLSILIVLFLILFFINCNKNNRIL